MNTVKIKVDNVMLEGTPDQLAKILTQLGLSPNVQIDAYYYSESKREYVKYSDMNVVHAWNAFVKLYDEFLLALREKVRNGELTPQNALSELVQFPTSKWFLKGPIAERLASEIFKRS